jgi:hypothetical protein
MGCGWPYAVEGPASNRLPELYQEFISGLNHSEKPIAASLRPVAGDCPKGGGREIQPACWSGHIDTIIRLETGGVVSFLRFQISSLITNSIVRSFLSSMYLRISCSMRGKAL